MANTPTREHRERAVELLRLMAHANLADLIAAALCDAEQRGYERGQESWLPEVQQLRAACQAAHVLIEQLAETEFKTVTLQDRFNIEKLTALLREYDRVKAGKHLAKESE